MVSKELVSAFSIPLILVILLAVISGFNSGSAYAYEGTVTNETVGTGDQATYSTAYDAKSDSVTAIYNGTTSCPTEVCNATYTPGESATIHVGPANGEAIYVTYTGYTHSSYSSFEKVTTGTESGFNLASMLPFAIIGLTILALVLKYLGVF